jgi:hypothetical protein
MKKISTITIILLMASLSYAQNTSCGYGETLFNGNCYKVMGGNGIAQPAPKAKVSTQQPKPQAAKNKVNSRETITSDDAAKYGPQKLAPQQPKSSNAYNLSPTPNNTRNHYVDDKASEQRKRLEQQKQPTEVIIPEYKKPWLGMYLGLQGNVGYRTTISRYAPAYLRDINLPVIDYNYEGAQWPLLKGGFSGGFSVKQKFRAEFSREFVASERAEYIIYSFYGSTPISLRYTSSTKMVNVFYRFSDDSYLSSWLGAGMGQIRQKLSLSTNVASISESFNSPIWGLYLIVASQCNNDEYVCRDVGLEYYNYKIDEYGFNKHMHLISLTYKIRFQLNIL